MIGMIGLGRSGAGLVRRLLEKGHQVAGYDPVAHVRQDLAKAGMVPAENLPALIGLLRSPKGNETVRIWLSIPSGPPVDDSLRQVLPLLSRGDMIVDTGISRFSDTLRRAKILAQTGAFLLDAGITTWEGKVCSLVVGGEKECIDDLGPVFDSLAPGGGYLHTGPVGSGHFVKMVSRGIESAFLQAMGEGFEILRQGPFDLDLGAVARIWSGGTVAGSRWLEILSGVFGEDPSLSSHRGYSDDQEEVRWTAETAIECGVFSPLLTLALMEGRASRQGEIFSHKLVAALRNASGGHRVMSEPGSPA